MMLNQNMKIGGHFKENRASQRLQLFRQVLGGATSTSPNDKVNIAYIGCGTQGIRQLIQALPHSDVQITSVCDPNEESTDYIPYVQKRNPEQNSRISKNRNG